MNDAGFAEFVGILLGDGYLSDTGIEITLNKKTEENYANYIISLMARLFKIKPHVRVKGNSIGIILNSKVLVGFLVSAGLHSGRKSDATKIPEFIFKNNESLKCCVRGLIDTDGGVFNKQAPYRRCLIEFKNASASLRQDTACALKLLGFHTSSGGYRAIRIQEQKEVNKYFSEIGTSNKKNEIRYKEFAAVV